MKQVDRVLHFLLPGLGDMLWISTFVAVIGLGPRMLNIDGDLGRHLTIGGFILDQGRVPTTDLFSHTMLGQPLTPHEWLAQVIFALANRMMGLDGVVLVCALVIATSFWLVFRLARGKSHVLLAAVFVTVLAMAAASLHWLARPHVFTFLLLAAWVNLLEDLRRGRLQRWWLLPALMLVWANLHGAFIAGFVTWGLYGLGLAWDAFWRRFPAGEGLHGKFWRYYLLGGAAAFLATLANPAGIGLWSTSAGYIGNRYLVGHTAEYLPPNFHDPVTWPFLVMIGLLVLVFGLQQGRHSDAGNLPAAFVLPAAAWMVMGLYSVRNVPLFAIVAAPVLAVAVGDWLAASHHRVRLLKQFTALDQRLLRTDLSLRGVLWPVVAVVLVIIGLRSGTRLDFQQRGNQFDPQVFPVQAVDWLVEHPQQGELFNHFPWGGYLLYRRWPEQRVFIDGQTDFYGEPLTRQYEQVITLSPGWEDVLNRYKVRWALIPPDSTLSNALRSRSGWQVLYEDTTAIILARRER
jgi:hypothetical protein